MGAGHQEGWSVRGLIWSQGGLAARYKGACGALVVCGVPPDATDSANNYDYNIISDWLL